MKFHLTFKTPDVTDQLPKGMSSKEKEEAKEFLERFVEFGEYVTVDFDTKDESATVREVH